MIHHYSLIRLDDIYTLIESGDITNGTCELYCRSNNICILTCDVSHSCHDIDITVSTDTILIIDCISTDSCNQVSTDGNNALLICIETNEINALTDSEIYCPLYNQNNYTNTCIINGCCIDVYGTSHCVNDRHSVNDLIKNIFRPNSIIFLISIILISICFICFLLTIFICCKCKNKNRNGDLENSCQNSYIKCIIECNGDYNNIYINLNNDNSPNNYNIQCNGINSCEYSSILCSDNTNYNIRNNNNQL